MAFFDTIHRSLNVDRGSCRNDAQCTWYKGHCVSCGAIVDEAVCKSHINCGWQVTYFYQNKTTESLPHGSISPRPNNPFSFCECVLHPTMYEP